MSGSGKTRLIFEGLCQNWGFYLTSAFDQRDSSLGSSDLHTCIKERMLISELPNPSHLQYTNTLAQNRAIAHARLNEALLARIIIFGLFIDSMITMKVVPTDHYRTSELKKR